MKRGLTVALLIMLGGCAHYTPAPLATVPAWSPQPSPQSPLTVDDVVRLALENNPDLKAARAKRGVAQAAIVQAGLLPNPQLGAGILPLISGGGEVPAWNFGLSQDLKALITYASKQRSARDASGQAAADLLWQEWQVAGQARQLATDLVGALQQRPVAAELHAILDRRVSAAEQELAAGDITLTTVAPSRASFQAARIALNGVDQRILQLRHQLNALLGYPPETELRLSGQAVLPPVDATAIRAALATLPDRRPDLLALRLGYAAQEEAVRQAILMQFPDLILGGSATSDSSRVVNVGPQATLSLPIFDRGHGAIATARATREQMRTEYSARLAMVTGEVGAALAEIAQLEQQLAIAERDLPAARLAAARAVAARGASAIDEMAFVDLINTRFTKEQDVMALRLALLDRQIALQTLLGAGLPQIDGLPMIVPAGAGQ